MGTGDDSADCGEIIEALYLYLDGELTVEKRVQIQRHLEGCPPCFQAVGFERELRAVISTRCRDRVPDDLRERIKRAITDEGRG
jgi:mycothiol system anti-sigma-R factor